MWGSTASPDVKRQSAAGPPVPCPAAKPFRPASPRMERRDDDRSTEHQHIQKTRRLSDAHACVDVDHHLSAAVLSCYLFRRTLGSRSAVCCTLWTTEQLVYLCCGAPLIRMPILVYVHYYMVYFVVDDQLLRVVHVVSTLHV